MQLHITKLKENIEFIPGYLYILKEELPTFLIRVLSIFPELLLPSNDSL